MELQSLHNIILKGDCALDYQPFPKLTKDFVEEQMQVGWADLAWAASHHWLDVKSLGELADRLAITDENLRVELAIATMNEDSEAVDGIIQEQAHHNTIPDGDISARWMMAVVAWIYKNRDVYDDPLAVIEDIWEAFGHPPALNGLIRWMPASPDGKVGDEAMLERWRELAVPLRGGWSDRTGVPVTGAITP